MTTKTMKQENKESYESPQRSALYHRIAERAIHLDTAYYTYVNVGFEGQ